MAVRLSTEVRRDNRCHLIEYWVQGSVRFGGERLRNGSRVSLNPVDTSTFFFMIRFVPEFSAAGFVAAEGFFTLSLAAPCCAPFNLKAAGSFTPFICSSLNMSCFND